ncbi:hypothetical protein PGT21_017844 [Puccinia graminis f. sp. tritici]|uniref:Uncharacterized protein n=1 Tax=Puccinia graminis f. sp. tritici TaxID=56615 RepID=A0A5B0QB45_PUCGR|nr:hypothetical protein PGT21_017844 [Puccinia graminis f. sp. tritici]
MVDELAKRATRSNLLKAPKATLTAPIGESLSATDPTNKSRQTLELDSESDDSETFKEMSEQNAQENPSNTAQERPTAQERSTLQDRPSNHAKYQGILGNVPEIVTSDDLSVSVTGPDQAKTLSTTDDPTTALTSQGLALSTTLDVPAVKSDKALLWDKIAEAVLANDKTNADFFIRLYSQISNSVESTKPDISRSRSSDGINPLIHSSSTKKSSDKTSIIFVRGSLPKHFDVRFTPYFDKNIKELRGPIPLTIFDKKWQEDAIQFHTNKRSKGDKKDGSYTGFEYPNEWTQTFAKWTANHRNFHVTFRDLYNYPDFADWILEHKANVDRIIAEDGFLVGFRYDLIIRQNAFSYQVETDKGTSAVDISIFRKDVKREAWKATRNLDELEFSNNPYAKDGPKFNFDPKTGKPKITKGRNTDDSSHHFESRGTRGRGNFRNSRGSERFNQERRNSDYGSYREEAHGYDRFDNKRPREVYQNEDYFQNRQDYQPHRGGYGKGGPGYGRGNSSKISGKETPKGKEKDNL